MLSQLGLPASNRDTLTLIHSTGEVLSLAHRRESTNTETFTLHQIGSAAYIPLPPCLTSLSLSLSAPPIAVFYSVSLSLSSSQSAVFPQASFLVSVIFVAVYLSICVSLSSSPFSFPSSCQYQSLFICISNSLTPLHSYIVSARSLTE